MIFGRMTFETLPGVLPGRLHVVMSRSASEWDERKENLVYTSKKPAEIIAKLKSIGFENPIVAGGAIINSLFAKEQLIDEIILTISPKIFGAGLGIFQPDIEMEDIIEQVNNDLDSIFKVFIL